MTESAMSLLPCAANFAICCSYKDPSTDSTCPAPQPTTIPVICLAEDPAFKVLGYFIFDVLLSRIYKNINFML